MNLRLRHRRASRERGVGRTLAIAVAFALFAGAASWVALIAGRGVPGVPKYTLEAQFEDLSNLGDLNEVRIAGNRVGQVLDPRIENGQPVVDLQLDDEVEPLRADTRLVVRSKGLLGQRFLELQPGRSGRPLRDGERIPSSQTSATVNLLEVLRALDEPRRHDLRAVIDGFGEGMLGRGDDLNRMFERSPALLRELRSVSTTVLSRTGAARRFFPSLESAAAAADPVREDIAAGFEPEARALQPYADRRPALQGTFEAAPPALTATREGLARTDPFLAAVGRLARATTGTLRDAPAALRETRALLEEMELPLLRTGVLLERVPPSVPPVVRLARDLTPVLPRVEDFLADQIPGFRVLGPRECDVLGWARNWRSMLAFGVPGGGPVGPLNVLRFELIASQESVGELSEPPRPEDVGANPYPAPCEAGTEKLP